MPEPTYPATMDPVSVALQKKCDQLYRDLIRERKRLVRGTVLTTIVTLLLMAAIGVYFYIGYTTIRDDTQPIHVVDFAQATVEDHLPRVRMTIQREVERSAPTWAAELSRHGLQSMPQIRERVGAYFDGVVDQMLKKTTVMTDEHFQKFVHEHKPLLDRLVKDATARKQPTKQTLDELQEAIDKEVQIDMKSNAQELVKNLDSCRANLVYLAANKGLTPEQQTERRWWMLCRRMVKTGEIVNIELMPSADTDDGAQQIHAKPPKGAASPSIPQLPKRLDKPKGKTPPPPPKTTKPADTKTTKPADTKKP